MKINILALRGPKSGKGAIGNIFQLKGWTVSKPTYVVTKDDRTVLVFVSLYGGLTGGQKRAIAALNQTNSKVEVAVVLQKSLTESDPAAVALSELQDVPDDWSEAVDAPGDGNKFAAVDPF